MNTKSFSIGNGVMVCSDAKEKTSEELRVEFLTFCDEQGDMKDENKYWDFVKKYKCIT